MIKKILLVVCFFFLVAALLAGAAIFSAVEFVRVGESDDRVAVQEKLVQVVYSDDGVRAIFIREDAKPFIKRVAREAARMIYREAEIHNPEGDMLPDEVDDTVKKYIQETVQ